MSHNDKKNLSGLGSGPILMGILNVTPDSFYDGGKFLNRDDALRQCQHLVSSGAHIVDVGGQSTRPGSQSISVEEELDRVMPVIEAIQSEINVMISVDTQTFEVAEAAVQQGVQMINDVSGGADDRMMTLGSSRVHYAIMHMQGTPETMQQKPAYPEGVVSTILGFLKQKKKCFMKAGFAADQLWFDPGVGFGKTLDHNIEIIKGFDRFSEVSPQLMIGTSQKSFIARILEQHEMSSELKERHEGTLVSSLLCYQKGARIMRVHDVHAMKKMLLHWETLR